MFLLIVLAAAALVGIVYSVHAVISDAPERVRTLDNYIR
jgi:xanthosine utilization system XapX-like protein